MSVHKTIDLENPPGFELLHTLKNPEGSIFSLGWSPNGKVLALGTTDNVIQVWDAQRGELRASLKHQSPVSNIIWAPDGQMLATGLWNKTVELWDAHSAGLCWTLEHDGIISSLAWNPDARVLATGTGESLIYLWNAKTGKLLKKLAGHTDGVICLAWSPDGRILASGSDDQTICLWHAASGKLLHVLQGTCGEFISVSWSADGHLLASGTIDECLQLWEPQSGQLLQNFEGISGNIETTAWSSHSRVLASGTLDKVIYILDVNHYLTIEFWNSSDQGSLTTSNPKPTLLEGHSQRILGLRFSADSHFLASKSADHTVRLWRCDTWKPVAILHETSTPIFGGLAFHPQQPLLATCNQAENIIRLWRLDYEILLSSGKEREAATVLIESHDQQPAEELTPIYQELSPPGFTLIHTLHADDNVCELDWNPDGKTISAAQTNHVIQFWEGETGQPLQILTGHEDTVYEVAWSPNGRWLASGSTDQTVRVWDGHTGTLLYTLYGHSNDVGSLTWSPDSTLLASGSRDQTIRLWDSRQGTLLQTLEGHRGPIYDLDWSPDGTMLVSASFDKTIRIWKVPEGKQIRLLEGHGGAVTSIAWSPDGHFIASGFLDNTIHLWDAASGRQLGILEGHTDIVLCIRFSPDGRFLASKSYDSTVRLWRCDTWNMAAQLEEPAQALIFGGLSFHPSAPFLATLGERAGEIRIWQLDYETLYQIEVRADVRYYRNAKVVLMGDTGVGKSGLALVLTDQEFHATESTHGRHVWSFRNEEAVLPNGQTETRETLLWDLAGQPGYRLIHQLHLNEVAVALMVIDSRSEQESFGGVQHWNRALEQACQMYGAPHWPLKKFLVIARADRGGLSISQQRLTELLEKFGFDGFFETSAREGWQIAELQTAIQEAIQWEALPKVSSNELFQIIMQFLVDEKQAGRVLSNASDLYRMFCRLHPKLTQDKELEAKFETCIARVETRGLIRRLSFGGYILLQPELLDSYASGMINAAKAESDGRGSLPEEDVLSGHFRMPADERAPDPDQEKLLLIATVEELLRHELALKELDTTGAHLVFPSQITRESPHDGDIAGKTVVYTFEGAILNAYVSLVIRLSLSSHFHKHERWRNVATYTTAAGGTCGLALRPLEEGQGEVTIFFDDAVTPTVRSHFEAYIATYLERVALPNTVQRHPIIACTECGEQVPESMLKRLRERGRSSMLCPICGAEIFLTDQERQIADRQILVEMDQAADMQRKRDMADMVLRGKLVTEAYDVFLVHLPQDRAEVMQIGELLKKHGILSWLAAWEGADGEAWQLEPYLERMKAVVVCIGDVKNDLLWRHTDTLRILQRFRTLQRPIILVCLSACQSPPDLPESLQGSEYLNFHQSKSDSIEHLVERINGEKDL